MWEQLEEFDVFGYEIAPSVLDLVVKRYGRLEFERLGKKKVAVARRICGFGKESTGYAHFVEWAGWRSSGTYVWLRQFYAYNFLLYICLKKLTFMELIGSGKGSYMGEFCYSKENIGYGEEDIGVGIVAVTKRIIGDGQFGVWVSCQGLDGDQVLRL